MKEKLDIVNGPLYKNIFVFSVPIMLTQLIQLAFNAADTIVVGKFAGQEALAAVGATGSMMFLLISLFGGLGMGASVVIGQALGARDAKSVSKAVHTSITLSVVAALFLTVFGQIVSRPLLELMGTPRDIIDLSLLYLRIIFAGMIFDLTYNFGAAIMRAEGDSKRPLVYLSISGALNVILNLIFVIVFKMSVAGVALATVLSHVLSTYLIVNALLKKADDDPVKLHLNQLKVHMDIVAKILRIGIPAGIQGAVFALSNVIIQSCVNSFGSVVVAGNSAAANIESFGYIAMQGFSQATVTFTSQNVGARRNDNVVKVLKATIILTIASSILISGGIVLFRHTFLSLYTNEEAVITVGSLRILIVVSTLVFNGILDILVGSMRGMGASSLPTIVMIVGICGIRLSWLFIVFPMFNELAFVYLCYPISWIITSVLQIPMWIKVHKSLPEKSR